MTRRVRVDRTLGTALVARATKPLHFPVSRAGADGPAAASVPDAHD